MFKKGEGGVTNMCEVLDKAEAKGRIEGRIEGKIELLLEDGASVEAIARRLNMDISEVEHIIASLDNK